MRLVNRALDGLQAAEVLFILDACRNDPQKGRGDGDAALSDEFARGLRPVIVASGPAKPKLVATLLACDAGQRAWEDPDSSHGAFTVYLLKGVVGAAADADGQVKLSQLAGYVQKEVADWASRHGKVQSPRLLNPDGGDMVVSVPPPEAVVSVSFQNVTLTKAIAELAAEYGTQIVLGPGVDPEGKVNGRLEMQPLGTALRLLLLALDLKVRRDGPVYVIEKPLTAAVPTPTPTPTPTPPSGGRPAGWPGYLSSYQPPAGMSWSSYRVSPKDGMPQVLIPAGEFLMGSPDGQGGSDEHPQKKVYVSAFWMDLHEVTNEQYGRFVKAAHYKPSPDWEKWSRDTSPRHPAAYVSWDDASAYARWAGRQLPTEAQWEKAARGGTTTVYPWGDQANPELANGNWNGDRQWTAENAVRYMKPVGSYLANRFGLVDMIGNVWEWCRDWYDGAWYGVMPGRDPCNTTQANVRVCRGGSWTHNPGDLRVAYRNWCTPGDRGNNLGLRCSEAP